MITKFHNETSEEIRAALTRLNQSRERVRIFYGDTKTGEAWPEEFQTLGYIGNSTGQSKIPLVVSSERSMGGGALLDHCIVAIFTTKGRQVYKHPTFNAGKWAAFDAVEKNAEYPVNVFHNGTLHARFKDFAKATRFIQFMQGNRFSK